MLLYEDCLALLLSYKPTFMARWNLQAVIQDLEDKDSQPMNIYTTMKPLYSN